MAWNRISLGLANLALFNPCGKRRNGGKTKTGAILVEQQGHLRPTLKLLEVRDQTESNGS